MLLNYLADKHSFKEKYLGTLQSSNMDVGITPEHQNIFSSLECWLQQQIEMI